MKRNKRGMSLIILVVTIIVMIILAAAVIITLDNSGIISKANEAVDAIDLNQVQHAASLVWAEAYLDKVENVDEAYIRGKLEEQGLDVDDYTFTVEVNGVAVSKRKGGTGNEVTLGSLITSAEMYGTKINYEANGVTDWKVFYSQTVGTEEYVYLIASEELAHSAYYNEDGELTELGTKLTNSGATIKKATVTLGTDDTRTVGQIYWSSSSKVPSKAATIQNPTLWMAEWGKYDSYSTNTNGICVSYFLDENIWKDFANTEEYKDANGNSYVVGAIGTTTAEMFVASWNAIREATGNTSKYDKKLKLEPNKTTGYYVNDITASDPSGSNTTSQSISTSDPLYIWSTVSNSSVWLASPSGGSSNFLLNAYYGGYVDYYAFNSSEGGARPVVCLKASIPVSLVDGNFVIK